MPENRGRKGIPIEIKIQIVDMYEEGLTIRFVAKKSGVGVDTVKKALKDEGVYEQ